MQALAVLDAATADCAKLWASVPITGVVAKAADSGLPLLAASAGEYGVGAAQQLLARVVRLSNALFVVATACTTDAAGVACTRSATAFLPSCPLAVTPTAVPAPGLLFSGSPTSACRTEAKVYGAAAGCCAATRRAAQLRWWGDVLGQPALGKRFLVAWDLAAADVAGASASVSTAVPQEFRWPDACNGQAAVVDAFCLVQLAGAAEGWPDPCCDRLVCANGGRKRPASACFCECSAGWTKAACTVRAAHVILSMVLQGASRANLPPSGLSRLLALVASISTVDASQAECALIADGLYGMGIRANGAMPALRVQVRVVCKSVAEALSVGERLNRLRQAQVLQQRLTESGFGAPGQVGAGDFPHAHAKYSCPLNNLLSQQYTYTHAYLH
jgi:hypothetical protein